MDWRPGMGLMGMVDTGELETLKGMLDEAGIGYEYVVIPDAGGATIKIPDNESWMLDRMPCISVIQTRVSYGGPEGLLEIWIRDKNRKKDSPEGWLGAGKVFEMIKEGLK